MIEKFADEALRTLCLAVRSTSEAVEDVDQVPGYSRALWNSRKQLETEGGVAGIVRARRVMFRGSTVKFETTFEK